MNPRIPVSGWSKPVVRSRDTLIRAEIEKHNKVPYALVGHTVSVGVAIMVYAKDTVARRIKDVETETISCGPMWMGNKGAAGVRFRLLDEKDPSSPGEIFTYVLSHILAVLYHTQAYTPMLIM